MLDVDVESRDTVTIDIDVSEEYRSETDYTKLKNLPTLDGVPIVGNVKERDPTVPEWAKNENKPSYSASEVGAVDINEFISIEELSKLFCESEEIL